MEQNKRQPQISADGAVRITDSRVTAPISFTQLADVHLYPPPEDRSQTNEVYRAISCNGGLPPLVTPFNALVAQIAGMLDEVTARGDDFVAWSGDILDTYHPETAALVVNLCRERGLACYFQIGNHDWDYGWPPGDMSTRLPATKFDVALRNKQAHKMMTEDWGMPGLYYSFERSGVRFISADTLHRTLTDPSVGPINPASTYDETQADWIIDQLRWDGPMVLFQHVPFNPTTPDYQVEPWKNFIYGCVLEEDPISRRVAEAVKTCPNLLGVFVGHKHRRAEDPLGATWQFMVGLAAEGQSRRVLIERE